MTKTSARDPLETSCTGAAPTGAFDDYIVGDLSRVANRLARGAAALYRREFGVTLTQWRILHNLAERAPTTAREICDHTGIDKGPVSRAIRDLQALGHVEGAPSQSDSRSIDLRLTASGRALHDRIMPVAMARQQALLASLSGEEAGRLKGMIEKLEKSSRALDRE